jgi:hypothetical protein
MGDVQSGDHNDFGYRRITDGEPSKPWGNQSALKLNQYVHEVKSWTLFFEDILKGVRTSDIRYTGDRRYMVGDILLLKEWDPVKSVYTGRIAQAEITYIQQNKSNPCAISREALADDYAVLSIKLLK